MFPFPYRLKLWFLKNRTGNMLWRRWRVFRKDHVGDYARLPEYIRNYTAGKSFVDIGCMWGVNGEYAFVAEEAGASSVKGVDIFGPTPEFEQERLARNSSVEFILGDASHPETLERIGECDVVFCAGVLYHHPSPFDLLVALRRICRETLILRTSTIPEIAGLSNAAVYWPMLNERDRAVWDLRSLGLSRQVGITDPFAPEEGYGNWFWGMTPSCLVSLLETSGFQVDWRFTEPFAQTVICKAVEQPFAHRLPDEQAARRMAEQISASGVARPA
jgi:SAM-dependent methyltransferase